MRVIAGETSGWSHYRVTDANTGAEIKHCLWADDETGEYEQFRVGDDGRVKHDGEQFLTDIKRGNIRLLE